MKSDEDILAMGGTQEDISRYAHDVGGACSAEFGYCNMCPPDTTKKEGLTEAQKIIAYYGQRCALQNGNGSTTPGVDFNNAVDAIGSLINQQVLEAIAEIKSEQETEAKAIDGEVITYVLLSDIEQVEKRYRNGTQA